MVRSGVLLVEEFRITSLQIIQLPGTLGEWIRNLQERRASTIGMDSSRSFVALLQNAVLNLLKLVS